VKRLVIAATTLAVLGAAGSAAAQYQQRRTPLLEPGQGIAQPPVRKAQPTPYGYGSPPAYKPPSYDTPGYGFAPAGRNVGDPPRPMDPYARENRAYNMPTYPTYTPSYQRKRR
jgi:hypothetical protein